MQLCLIDHFQSVDKLEVIGFDWVTLGRQDSQSGSKATQRSHSRKRQRTRGRFSVNSYVTVLCCCCRSQCLISNCRAAKGEKSLSLPSVFVVRWPMGRLFGCGDVMWSRPPAFCCLLQLCRPAQVWKKNPLGFCLSCTRCSSLPFLDLLFQRRIALCWFTPTCFHLQHKSLSVCGCLFILKQFKTGSISFQFFHSAVFTFCSHICLSAVLS